MMKRAKDAIDYFLESKSLNEEMGLMFQPGAWAGESGVSFTRSELEVLLKELAPEFFSKHKHRVGNQDVWNEDGGNGSIKPSVAREVASEVRRNLRRSSHPTVNFYMDELETFLSVMQSKDPYQILSM